MWMRDVIGLVVAERAAVAMLAGPLELCRLPQHTHCCAALPGRCLQGWWSSAGSHSMHAAALRWSRLSHEASHAQVNMPGHICAVVVTTLVLEGWSSKLDPRHSVLEQVEAIVSPKTSWGQRLGNAVDAVMVDTAPLCDTNL